MRESYALIVIGMGLVTFLPRWLPLILLSRRRLPSWLIEWLDFIPAAILGALLAPSLMTSGDPRHLDIGRIDLFVALPTLIVALKTRSLAGTVVAGMALYWAAGKILAVIP